MFRKTISMVCAVVLAVLMACSCAQQPADTSSKASDASSGSADTSSAATDEIDLSYPIVDELLTVKGVMIDDGADMTHPRLCWEKVKEVTNVFVEWEQVASDAASVFYAATDSWPDIIFYPWGDMSSIIYDYGVLGHKFVDFNDYLQYMPNLQKTYEDYPNARKCTTEEDGGIYQLCYIGKDCTAVTARFYYRQDTLKNAGVDEIPETVDELYDAMVKVRDYNGGAAPLAEDAMNFLWSSFGPGKNPDFEDDGSGNVIYNRISDQYKLYLEYMAKLYDEGLLHKEYLTLDSATKISLATEGKLVFGNAGVGSLAEDAFESGKVEITQLTPLTSEYDSEREVVGWNYAIANGLVVNAASEHIVEICRVLDVMHATEDVVEGTGLKGVMFNYGEENVHWKWANEEKTEYELILPEEFEGVMAFGEYQINYLTFSRLSRFDIFANAVTSTEGNNKARQQGFVNNLIPYQEEVAFPNLKFLESEQDVLTNNLTTIKEYVTQSTAEFISGVKSVDTDWDTYVEEINKMGLEDVLKVYQDAYDRWNAM